MPIVKKPIKDIIPNDYNPNKMLPEKYNALKEGIKKFGNLQPILIDKNNIIIDGEHRHRASEECGLETIDCVIFDSNENLEEYKKLLTLSMNNLRGETDVNSFDNMIKDICKKIELKNVSKLTGFKESTLTVGLMKNEKIKMPKINTIGQVDENLSGANELKFEVEVKETHGKFEMPLLDINKITCIEKGTKVYAGQKDFNFNKNYLWLFNSMSFSKCENRENIIPCFYTDDYRFDPIWNDPTRYFKKFINLGIKTIFTPNWSLWLDMPLAWQIYNTYKSRYIGYFMQQAGFDIIPDLNFSDNRSHEFCFDGIPEGCESVSIQCQHVKKEKEVENFYHGLDKGLELIKPKNLIVYGGRNKEILLKKYENYINIIYIDSFSLEREFK